MSAQIHLRVCYTCGGSGSADCLKTCCFCKETTEHVFCMTIFLHPIPKIWCCDDCKEILFANQNVQLTYKRIMEECSLDAQKYLRELVRKYNNSKQTTIDVKNPIKSEKFEIPSQDSHQRKREINIEAHYPPSKYLAVPKSVGNGKQGLSLDNEDSGKEFSPDFHRKETMEGSSDGQKCIFEIKVENVALARIKEEPNEDCLDGDVSKSPSKIIRAAKSTVSVDKQKPFMKPCEECPSMTETAKGSTIDKKFDDLHDKIAAGLRPSSVSGTIQPFSLLLHQDPNISNSLNPAMYWEGIFRVSDKNFNSRFGVQAHLSRQASDRVASVSKEFNGDMKFNILSRLLVWPKIFRLDPASHQDIALYFFPSKQGRSIENYMKLMEHINSNDLALQSYVGNAELMIYSSKQLSTNSESIGIAMYLWGVFRELKSRRHIKSKMKAAGKSITDITPGFSIASAGKYKRNNTASGAQRSSRE